MGPPLGVVILRQTAARSAACSTPSRQYPAQTPLPRLQLRKDSLHLVLKEDRPSSSPRGTALRT
jgi:hypothetical protein